MKIDVILDARASASDIAELGRLAEHYGLGAIWTSSLLDSRDPFTNMSVLATSSSSIRMGPIAVNPFDMHPVRIATSLLTLNELSGGRAQIVIGGGGEALEALNIEPHRRVRAVKECVEILKGASAEHALTYDGALYQVKGYHPRWATAPSPKVYVGANMEMMMTMAAKTADGIMLSDLPPGLVARAADFIHTKRQEAGCSDQPFALNNFFAWHVYDDKDQAHKEARQWLPLRGLFRHWVVSTFLTDADYDVIESHKGAFFAALAAGSSTIEGVPERIIDPLVQNLTLTGGVQEIDNIVERLIEFKQAGLTHMSLRLYQRPADSIKLIGERVAPALK